MFHAPTDKRKKHPFLGMEDGNNGFFQLTKDDIIYNIIASDGEGWEHVSVHVVEDGIQQTPTWDEMCYVKSVFWDKEDCIIQYHPPESEYVNNHSHVLHLWRPTNQTIPLPDSILVGIKGLNLNQ